MTLTGKIRHRAGFFGGCVLQVEEVTENTPTIYRKRWRDATVSDLSELTAMVFSKIDVYLPQVPDFSEEGRHGAGKPN